MMKSALVFTVAAIALTACATSDPQALTVRNGPQTQDPHSFVPGGGLPPAAVGAPVPVIIDDSGARTVPVFTGGSIFEAL